MLFYSDRDEKAIKAGLREEGAHLKLLQLTLNCYLVILQ